MRLRTQIWIPSAIAAGVLVGAAIYWRVIRPPLVKMELARPLVEPEPVAKPPLPPPPPTITYLPDYMVRAMAEMAIRDYVAAPDEHDPFNDCIDLSETADRGSVPYALAVLRRLGPERDGDGVFDTALCCQQALVRVTGKDVGMTAVAWERYLRKHGYPMELPDQP